MKNSDPFFELQRVLVEKGSGPACVPFWVERDFLWVRRRRIRPRPIPNLVFFNPPQAGYPRPRPVTG